MTTPKLSTLQIGAGTDIPALRALLMKSISEVAIPFLSELDSLEKIAAYYISRNIPAEATIVAAIYLIRGRFDDAEAVIQEAGKNAPTDHVREQNEKSFKKMLAKLG